MVPVRKPGRPLSSCPCPPDRPCGCGGVKIAIPRKQKCGCGGGDTHATEDHARDDQVNGVYPEPIPAEVSMSPPSMRPAYRVTKSGSTARSHPRRPSYDPNQLARMDPNSVNIVNAFNGMNAAPLGLLSQPVSIPMTTAAPLGMGYVSAGVNGFSQSLGLGYQTPLGYAPPPQQVVQQHVLLQNGLHPEDQQTNETAPTPAALAPTAPLQAVSNGINGTNGTNGHASPTKPPASTQTNGTSETGGSCCCGPKKESPELKPKDIPPFPTNAPAKSVLNHSPQPVDFKPFEDPLSQQTIYTYPPGYGSWSQPVMPALWQQIAGMSAVVVDAGGAADGVGFSHECTCGPGCACVGCLAHPFNQEMFNYVNNAYSDADVSPIDGPAKNHGGANGNGAEGPNGRSSSGGPGTEPASPPQAQTPSDASGFSEEQALSTSDFFFVSIPYDPSACNGSEVFCPCGDDCGCDGCVVHKTMPIAA